MFNVSQQDDLAQDIRIVRLSGTCQMCHTEYKFQQRFSVKYLASACCEYPAVNAFINEMMDIVENNCCCAEIRSAMLYSGNYCGAHPAIGKWSLPKESIVVNAWKIKADDISSFSIYTPAVYDNTGPNTYGNTESDKLRRASRTLPGISSRVAYPCECYSSYGTEGTPAMNIIHTVIVHLNDTCKRNWSREDIANWLDEIDDPYGDGPDLSF